MSKKIDSELFEQIISNSGATELYGGAYGGLKIKEYMGVNGVTVHMTLEDEFISDRTVKGWLLSLGMEYLFDNLPFEDIPENPPQIDTV